MKIRKRLIFTVLILGILAVMLLTAYAAETELKIESEQIEDNIITYTISASKPLSGTLICAIYGENNELKKVSFQSNIIDQQNWIIPIKAESEKGLTKIMFWDFIEGLQPKTGAVVSHWDKNSQNKDWAANDTIADVINNPAFGDYGRLIFPANTNYYSGNTLGELSLTWYGNMATSKTVEIVNYMKNHAEAGETIFYDIYTDVEKAADPAKKDTGLFFFKGNPGEKFAVCNAGGGFVFVGAMQDSFPHALELSKKGYNAFALIYRPGAQTACEDLARALSFIFEHADELEVDTDCYSLWGGSAGARMAANLGSYGSADFGGADLPRAGTVIMQYTGHSDYTKNDPPTFAVVGENDGIASWRTMESRINALKAAGIDTEFHKYPGLGHGFGIGIGTSAEGWLENAVKFWEKHMRQ